MTMISKIVNGFIVLRFPAKQINFRELIEYLECYIVIFEKMEYLDRIA